jgi:hypothetical protein
MLHHFPQEAVMRTLRSLALAASVPFAMQAGAASADVIADWNEIALKTIVAVGQRPPDQSRSMAMVHLAMFNAVNAIDRRYAPYRFDARAPAATSGDAAAAAAARGVLVKLVPAQQAAVDKALATSLANVPEGAGKSAGIAIGERAAEAILAERAGDGTDAPNTYRPYTSPGVYVPTALPLSSEWPKVKPFVMAGPTQFRPGPPPALTSQVWERDYKEIKAIGGRASSTRTPEQTEVGRFWALTGPASWNPVVRQLAATKPLGLAENARLFALVYLAATDSFVAVFDAKYAYNFWRPITAIRNADLAGNGAMETDAGWLPLVDTPMHPEYPCAHCISSAAVGAVLESEFGTGTVPQVAMTSPTAPGVTRKWVRVADYVSEVSNARVWSGVHYRNSAEVGEGIGRKIGALTVQTALRPAR